MYNRFVKNNMANSVIIDKFFIFANVFIARKQFGVLMLIP